MPQCGRCLNTGGRIRTETEKRLLKWQILVIGTVFLAYMLHYFCKVHLYVVLTDFKEYLSSDPDKAARYTGIMLSLGYVGYASGKILLGIFIDSYLKSAVKALLITLVLAPVLTILFVIIQPKDETVRVTVVCILWFAIRFVIASAWIGLVKLVSHWIPPSHHGRVMAFCNLSWLFGDSLARAILGEVYVWFDESWHSVFWVSAGVTALAIFPTIGLIRESPMIRGLPEVEDSADNVFAKQEQRDSAQEQLEKQREAQATHHDDANNMRAMSVLSMNEADEMMLENTRSQRPSFCGTLAPLLREPLLYMVVVMNFQYLFVRELYNVFFIAFLEDEVKLAKNVASAISSITPFVGCLSVIAAGIWLDKVQSKHWRLSIIPIFCVVTMCCLGCFVFFDASSFSTPLIIVWVIVFGLSLYGPYSLMSGVLAVDIGGKHAGGLVSGFISAAGYCAGIVVGLISAVFTYQTMWTVAMCCAAGIVFVGVILFFYNRRLWRSRTLFKNMIDEKQALV